MITNMTVGGVNVLRDLGIYIKTRRIQLPEPKDFFVEIPGADGSLDLSTALTAGDLKFEDRVVEVDFTSVGDYMGARDKLAKLLHGRAPSYFFHDDPEFYFQARRTVIDDWEYDEDGIPTFTVRLTSHPYRYKREITRLGFDIDGSALIVPNGRLRTQLYVSAENPVTVGLRGKSWSLQPGESVTGRGMILHEGDNRVLISGSGRVTLSYQEGEL